MLLTILLLLITVWILVQFTPVQNWLVKQAAKKLSRDLNTEVSIKHVDFALFNKVLLEGVLVKDLKKDTLAYIGRAGMSITDYFFLKEKAEISSLSLENTNIYLQRTDSVWNYQFLIDYFSVPPSTKKKKGIEYSIKQLVLTKIHLLSKDQWIGQNQELILGYLRLDVNKFDLKQKIIELENFEINEPSFSIYNFTGIKPKLTPKTDEEFHLNDSIEKWNPEGWIISATSVLIKNGEFKNDNQTGRPAFTYFDGAHLKLFAINGEFSNLKFSGDTIQSKIRMSIKERSGFVVNELQANMIWHTTGMEFKNLNLQTPNSKMGDYFAMKYSHFNHDLVQFITHVHLESNFKNSKLHSKDIAFFAPDLKDMSSMIYVSGKIKGSVEHLKGDSISITTGKNTIFKGKFTIDGLPDIDNTFLDISASRFSTTYNDLAAIYPALRKITKPALNQISYLNYKGSFTGYTKDFVTFGTIETNLGTLVTDLNFKLPKGKEAIYSGKLKTNGFQLGKFLNEKLFGKISIEGSLKGTGFNPKTLFAEVDAQLNQFEVNGYNFKNTTVKGIVEKRKFDGALAINDSNLIVNLTGLVDFGKDTPVYKVNGEIYKSNFKQLGFTKQNLSLSGQIDFNFSVKNIDDFMGTAMIKNAVLLKDTNQLSFDSLYLSNNFIDSGKKQFILRSNEIDVKMEGNYNLVNLPDVALAFLHNYFPAYIPQPRKKIALQDFNFDITTKNINQFINLLNAPVRGFDQSTIKGRIDIQKNIFNLETYVPSFEFNKILFNQVAINGQSNLSNLSLQGTIAEVKFTDSLSLPNTSFFVTAANDTGSVIIKTSASQTLKDADLKAKFKASKDGFAIIFQPSTLLVNDKRWTIKDESDLFIGKGKLFSNGITITSGNEELLAFTEPSATGTGNDFVMELKKFEIGDIMPYFLPDPRLEGSITGRIDIVNPLGKMILDIDLTADKFRFNNDSIGKVDITANYNSINGIINYKINSNNVGHDFTINGNTNIFNPEEITTDNTIEVENEELSLLEKYLSVIMTELKGTGKGTIRVTGDAKAPDIIGSVTLNDASFLLDYTKCRYSFAEGTVINFEKGAIDFGSIKLKDTTGRYGTFSGILYHQFFNDMAFDMNFKADDARRGLLVINTTKKDNSLFYGKIIANASGSITGPANDMQLTLRGEPTDSSTIYLPTSDSRVTGTANFIVFRKYGKEMKAETEIKEVSSLNVDLEVIANPYAKIYLILDEITNDIIEGQGNGVINLKVGTNERTTMSGNFQITKGRYTFNWQSLFKRPFLINNGTINWNGDPYDARINIDATYLVENAALLPELTNGCSSERYNIYVVSNLSNTLKNPVIKFRFELPQGHPCRNNPLTISGLNQLYNNEDELNRQVFSLLLLGSFNSANSTSSFRGNNISSTILSNAAGTISEFLAQQIRVGLDAVLKNIPGINKLKLDPYVTFTPGVITSAQAQGLGFQGIGNFGFTRSLLNGKILLKAGGSVLVSNEQTSLLGNNQLTPDISIEWLITPDGKLRLIGFYRSIIDAQRQSNRTGISLSYVKDFEEIF